LDLHKDRLWSFQVDICIKLISTYDDSFQTYDFLVLHTAVPESLHGFHSMRQLFCRSKQHSNHNCLLKFSNSSSKTLQTTWLKAQNTKKLRLKALRLHKKNQTNLKAFWFFWRLWGWSSPWWEWLTSRNEWFVM
jgi:hypothetical protein